MSTPRLWFVPNSFPERLTPDYDSEEPFERVMFIDGRPIEEPLVVPSFSVAAPRSQLMSYDVLPNAIDVPLVSSRVASIHGQICPNDIQLLPAYIHTKDDPITNYFLLNVTANIFGIDHSQSDVSMVPGTQCIMSVNRLRYAPEAMGDHHLAREREYPPFLWVSASVMRKFAEDRIRACEFALPESIHP